jgi:AAA domain
MTQDTSLVVQACSHWSVGLPFFGITCNGPLRILYVQAEDDEGDMTEETQIVSHLNFTSEQLELLDENTRMERVNGFTGQKFINLMNEFCAEWPPDLLVINPLQSFLGGDLKKDEILTPFLRVQLDGLLNACNIGVLAVGHTTKQSSKDIGKMDRLQRMYAIAGSAQMANWPRSMLFLANTDSVGVYDLWAVKKWQRVWEPGTDYVKLAHSFDNKLLWHKASIEQQFKSMAKVKLEAEPEHLLPFIPLEPGAIAFKRLKAKLNENREDPIGVVKIRDCLALLEEKKHIRTIGKGPKNTLSKSQKPIGLFT